MRFNNYYRLRQILIIYQLQEQNNNKINDELISKYMVIFYNINSSFNSFIKIIVFIDKITAIKLLLKKK